MMRIWCLTAFAMLAGCAQEARPPSQAKTDQPAVSPAMDMTPAQRAYADANARMHKAMGATVAADPDIAFVQGMIPHHEGAVEMAQIALRYGKDPEVRALATAIVKAQNAEIAQMKAWLAKRNVASPSAGMPIDHSKMGH